MIAFLLSVFLCCPCGPGCNCPKGVCPGSCFDQIRQNAPNKPLPAPPVKKKAKETPTVAPEGKTTPQTVQPSVPPPKPLSGDVGGLKTQTAPKRVIAATAETNEIGEVKLSFRSLDGKSTFVATLTKEQLADKKFVSQLVRKTVCNNGNCPLFDVEVKHRD